MKVDLVVQGRIYTMAKPQVVEAFAIGGGRIVALGEEALRLKSQRQIVLPSPLVVVPGFEDAHNHPMMMGRLLKAVDLSGCASSEEAIALLQRQGEGSDPRSWILARGWNNAKFHLTAEDLDRVSRHRPILVMNASMHGAVINTKGLSLLALPKTRPIKDGLLLEDLAWLAYERASPPEEALEQILLDSQKKLLSHGIVAVHDLYVQSPREVEAYKAVERKGELKIHVVIYLDGRTIGQVAPYRGKRVEVRGVKIFMDGALGMRTACLFSPYSDDPPNRGLLFLDAKGFDERIRAALEVGLNQVAVHCIGDRAILEAVEGCRRWRGKRDIQGWRLEHFEMPNLALSLVRDLGVIASMQPNFLWDAIQYRDRLGPRVDQICPHRAVLDLGIPLLFGSDDMPTGPLEGIWYAVNAPSESQRLTVEEALRAYTLEPAKSVGAEPSRGSLEVGKEASFVILSHDPFHVDPAFIKDIRVCGTWVRGEPLFLDPAWQPSMMKQFHN